MNNHLTPDQFAKCFAGRAGKSEAQHLRECPSCGAELDRFNGAISLFRNSIRDHVDARMASQAFFVPPISDRPASARIPMWRWAVAAAVILALVVLPSTIKTPQPAVEITSSEPSPEALMNAVTLHLSRTLPAPMEPMLMLIPSEEATTQTGGIQ